MSFIRVLTLVIVRCNAGLHGHPEEVEAPHGEDDPSDSVGLKEEEQPAEDPENKRPAALHRRHLRNFVASAEHLEHPDGCHEMG